VTTHIADVLGAAAGILSRGVSSVTHGAILFLLDSFVISFALFYFLGRSPLLVEHLAERIPVARSEAHVIVDRTLRVTSGALKSIVIGGTAQGVLIGGGFAVAGIGQPWFWGTVIALASTVPGVGSGIVWTPAAILLFLGGQRVAGIGLLFWGIVVSVVTDNLLRLYIVGRGSAIPGVFIFVSTIGGLMTFGPAGVLVGPAIVGVLLGVLDLYHAVLKSSGLSKDTDSSGTST
jgi:predicted PurR-regulated permease PerM